jgi:amino acid transporter
MKSFLSGVFGGAVLITIIALICIFSLKLHAYNVSILNPNQLDSLTINAKRIELINELHREGAVLTPQEYTNNIVSYYNTAITLLVFLFILFSFVSYFHLKFVSNEQIIKILGEKMKDSKEMEKIIMEAISGKADDKYATIESVEALKQLIEVDSEEKQLEEQSSKTKIKTD